MKMESSRLHNVSGSLEIRAKVPSGPARQCVVIDRSGKRMVLPRYSAADAIEQIAIAIAGRTASREEKLHAWERLRDEHGFSVKWLLPLPKNSEPAAMRGSSRE